MFRAFLLICQFGILLNIIKKNFFFPQRATCRSLIWTQPRRFMYNFGVPHKLTVLYVGGVLVAGPHTDTLLSRSRIVLSTFMTPQRRKHPTIDFTGATNER